MTYRYTKECKTNTGVVWRFEPPKDALDAGVVTRQSFRDGRTARFEIPKLIERVEAFRRGEIVAGNIGPTSTLLQVSKHYMTTVHYKSLSYNSKKSYDSNLNSINNTYIFNKQFGSIKIKDLTAVHCAEVYDKWCEEISINSANAFSRVLSVVLNYCKSLDLIIKNPMSNVRKRNHNPRSVVWRNEDVVKFLDTAFTQFRWRNIGLIALMCYEWGQRPTDIRLMKFDQIDWDNRIVTITQTKRGATVQLPIPDNLYDMLLEQRQDWGFQEYVVPYHRPADRAFRPLDITQVSHLANEVKREAGIPDDLRIGDLRKSAIVEMIDAGVDHLAIMSVTGHQNISSLNPYQKHTYAAAKSALERRKQ